ncbi:hypothetical protein M3Y99_01891900 [Aphelenchoides fujianensis]|nr:hypothetical protein M3Y99_01891900 [Aphelenchoides fujianensis]
MDAMVNGGSADSVLGLCERLRSERLLVSSELETLQQLNRTIESDLSKLSEKIWINRQEQLVLQRLINCDPNVQPDRCCRLLAAVNSARFVPAHRTLGHHVSTAAELFRLLINSPKAVAEFLNAVDHISAKELFAFTFDDLCRAVFNFLYGSCVFPLDERKMLDCLAHLISLQLVTKSEPRRVLRKGTSAFSKLYAMFSEELFSAKSGRGLSLDIDAGKLPLRFHPDDRRRRFGADEESRQFKERVAAYRRSVLDRLALITMQFVKCSFRSSLLLLICAAFSHPPSDVLLPVQPHVALSVEEADVICTDLLFTNFICQAITNPEPHGIIADTPISHVARFNLIQIGQILQTLALMPYEDPPAVMQDLLSRITENTMPDVVTTILDSHVLSIEGMFPGVVLDGSSQEMYARSACFGTLGEIQTMLEYLRTNSVDAINDEALRRSIRSLVRRLPEEFSSNSTAAQPEEAGGTPKSMLRSSSGRLRTFVDRVQHVAKTQQQRLLTNLPNSPSFELENSPPSNSNTPSSPPVEMPQVLVLAMADGHVPLGLESEEKIMSAVKPHQRKTNTSDSLAEKKTRFKATESIVSDHTATTDAASDDEDEAAASICSSDPALNDGMVDEDDVDEAEEDVSTLPDNFSDVVPISANVSGRGSPSLSGGRGSGRGTPFSGGGGPTDPTISVSSTVAEAAGASRNEAHRNLPKLPVTIKKQNPEGLEEKFGKFGLPPQDPSRYRDETYSLVSDSWSTGRRGFGQRGAERAGAPAASAHPAAQRPAGRAAGRSATTSPATRPPARPLAQLAAAREPLGQPHQRHHVEQRRERDPHDGRTGAHRGRHPEQIPNGPQSAVFLLPELLPPTTKADEAPYYDAANLTRCRAFYDAKRKLRLVLSSAANIPTNPTTARPAAHHERPDQRRGRGRERAADDPRGGRPEGRFGRVPQTAARRIDQQSGQDAECADSRSPAQSAGLRPTRVCFHSFRPPTHSFFVQDSEAAANAERRTPPSDLLPDVPAAVAPHAPPAELLLLEALQPGGAREAAHQRVFDPNARAALRREQRGLPPQIHLRFPSGRAHKYVLPLFVLLDVIPIRLQDERTYIVDRALTDLYGQIDVDPLWQGLSDENIEYVRKSMERALMTQIYQYALYPNQEADQYRDECVSSSLLLSYTAFFQRCSTSPCGASPASSLPDHPELRIPKRFHSECPWPSAQAEIAIMNAYKAPRDKMACILRCCETIEHLIGLASERGAASADDVTPILLYVLLQANPPALLSNIQYIEGFYARRMPGQEAYWWTQFRAAVEFLKSLCNKHFTASP